MVSPNEEVTLSAGLASVQATLTEQGKRLDRLESKVDAVLDRFDTIHPKMATLEQRISAQEDAVKSLFQELRERTAATRTWAQVIVAGILGGGVTYAIVDFLIKGR